MNEDIRTERDDWPENDPTEREKIRKLLERIEFLLGRLVNIQDEMRMRR